jgi:hypothetical protein
MFMMADNLNSEIKKLKKQLSTCQRKLKESAEFNERLRASVGYDELRGWKPQKRIETQYGWVFAWLHPLYTYIDQNINQRLTPDIRNKIGNIVNAIIAQLVINGKYGVTIPNEFREVDPNYENKQENYFKLIYEPCVICGEKRITHECHIIPRSEGGTLHRDNFVILCPLHHHLFDHSRLSREEWDILCNNLKDKMESAIIYANEVRLPALQAYWKTLKEK